METIKQRYPNDIWECKNDIYDFITHLKKMLWEVTSQSNRLDTKETNREICWQIIECFKEIEDTVLRNSHYFSYKTLDVFNN